MKKWIFIICCFIAQISSAQEWYSVDSGIHGKYDKMNVVVNATIVDTLHHFLYVVGTFDSAGNNKSSNFAFWDGTRWHPGAVNGGFFTPLSCIILYHDTAVLGGPGAGIAFWYDTSWVQKPSINPSGTSNQICFAVYHDTLWCGGAFGVKYYNGTKWVKPPGVFSTLLSYIEVNAMTEYNNELIIGGFFYGIGDTICHNIAAWDGKKWHSLAGGTKASWSEYTGNVFSLACYKNELYAGGFFDTAGGVYCHEIAKWNGVKWDSLNGNNICGETYAMLVADSNLYLGGNMFSSGVCITNQIARWDGNKLHDLNFIASGNGTVYSLAWFDGQLYAAGSFNVVNGNYSIQSIARSVIATGITSATSKNLSMEIFPNPATDVATISFPFSNSTITISDLYGRELEHFKIRNGSSAEVNIQSLQTGIYIVSISDEKGNLNASAKLFKAH